MMIVRKLTRIHRLISALAITPVGTYFLWPSGESGHHGHDEHHEEHHEEAEAKEEEKSQEDAESDEAKESGETSKPSGTEGDSQPKADDANKKSSGNEETEERMPRSGSTSTEGVQGKGQMSNESEGQNQGSKREPDGKGAFKNRKDSGLSKELSTDPEKTYAEDGKTEAVSRENHVPQSRTCIANYEHRALPPSLASLKPTPPSRARSPLSNRACPTLLPGTLFPSTSPTRRARSRRVALTPPSPWAPLTPTGLRNRRQTNVKFVNELLSDFTIAGRGLLQNCKMYICIPMQNLSLFLV
jgi:hypothetical protein